VSPISWHALQLAFTSISRFHFNPCFFPMSQTDFHSRTKEKEFYESLPSSSKLSLQAHYSIKFHSLGILIQEHHNQNCTILHNLPTGNCLHANNTMMSPTGSLILHLHHNRPPTNHYVNSAASTDTKGQNPAQLN
jgi:hypothetical protein